MKLKLLTLLPLYLKRSLKRNKIDRCILLSISLFFTGFLSLFAITADLKIDYSENPTILYTIDDADNIRLIKSLQKGYTSEVQIEILLYKKRKKPYSIFGDLLIENFEDLRKAEKDIFSEYILVKDREEVTYYDQTDVFLKDFFSFQIPVPAELNDIDGFNNYYLKIRSSLVYSLYNQPFNIFYLLNHKDRDTTGWIFSNLEQVRQ